MDEVLWVAPDDVRPRDETVEPARLVDRHDAQPAGSTRDLDRDPGLEDTIEKAIDVRPQLGRRQRHVRTVARKTYVRPGRIGGCQPPLALTLRDIAYDDPLAVRLIDELQADMVRRYGSPDTTPVDPAEFAPRVRTGPGRPARGPARGRWASAGLCSRRAPHSPRQSPCT